MLRNAFRERFEALAPDPLSAIINAAPAVAVFADADLRGAHDGVPITTRPTSATCSSSTSGE